MKIIKSITDYGILDIFSGKILNGKERSVKDICNEIQLPKNIDSDDLLKFIRENY